MIIRDPIKRGHCTSGYSVIVIRDGKADVRTVVVVVSTAMF